MRMKCIAHQRKINSFNFISKECEEMMYLIGTKDNSFKHKTVCRIAIKNSNYIR